MVHFSVILAKRWKSSENEAISFHGTLHALHILMPDTHFVVNYNHLRVIFYMHLCNCMLISNKHSLSQFWTVEKGRLMLRWHEMQAKTSLRTLKGIRNVVFDCSIVNTKKKLHCPNCSLFICWNQTCMICHEN